MRTLVVVAALVGTASIAHAAITHVPPAEATAGTAVELTADAPATTPSLVVHYRAHGAGAFTSVELVRSATAQWIAIVPATAVSAPGVDYYITAGDRDVFASSSAPHTLPVFVPAHADRRARDLARSGGRLSRIHSQFEWVEFGSRTIRDREVLDRYYRVDADFSYRLLAYPLEELRVGYTQLIGAVSANCGETNCDNKGFKVGGWFELGLGIVEGVRIDARAIVMATQEGFNPGARIEGRLGVRDASHIAMGVEYLADVGTSGFFRLGWGTVPRTPMAATVEVTQIPDENRDAGVRLYYDIARELGGGLRLGLRVGYAARNQNVAGFTGGGNVIIDF